MRFELLASDPACAARRGRLTTARGSVETPVFMPCGTQATVKTLDPRDLAAEGIGLILCNTYHLFLRPGHRVVQALGGLHRFMGWEGAILTDSGGYQVLSLAPLRRISEEGVTFQSHLDGARHLLTPETVVEIQLALGSDIAVTLDECPPHDADYDYHRLSMERTARWSARCRAAHPGGRGALFGILQGGTFPDLRTRSAEATRRIGFDGFAIGGLGLGEGADRMYAIVETATSCLPPEAPRYLMGVGTPRNLVECIARGADLFDCVLPTRNARNGTLFTATGRLNIKGAAYARDERPVDPGCACYSCRHFSRAYLRHLHLAGEMTAATLMTVHNLFHYLDIMRAMRQSIRLCRFEEWRGATLRRLAAADQDGS